MTDLLSLPTFDADKWLESDEDNFLVGLPLWKSKDASEQHWRFEGISSVEVDDLDGEEIVQKGVDCAPLMEWGQINWDHQDRLGPQFIIGRPLEVGIVSARDYAERLGRVINGPAIFTKGELYQDNPIAKGVRDYMEAFEQGLRPGRPLGQSVQGRTIKRDPQRPKRILKSQVNHLAITHQPVQRFTFAALAKSMSTESAQPILTENLHRKRLTIFGPCKGTPCYKSKGGFYRREHGALDHLVNCCGEDPQEAVSFILDLKKMGCTFT